MFMNCSKLVNYNDAYGPALQPVIVLSKNSCENDFRIVEILIKIWYISILYIEFISNLKNFQKLEETKWNLSYKNSTRKLENF